MASPHDTTLPPPRWDDSELEDLRLVEWLAMVRPYVWRGEIETERRASPDAATIRPERRDR